MRIGCLQFAPQVGKVNDNLNRADAVLNRAEPDGLDLLVLPELAFSGYNYKSLADIVPFLEHSGSGISSLWARTIALKYECTVIVGYPEKVDVSLNWPTSPEYYNAAIVVNGDGETVANYRKTHLFMTDEKWALESPQGFYKGFLVGLGRTAIGICMDLNPYRFEAPWDAFEFAFHVIQMQANLVILSMAWMTREDGRTFSRMPQEPDMDTLAYWVTRLEPVIRAEDDREVVVVFANRTGVEGDAVYAGTSAVLGIRDGEVRVYGMLGRGDKELLVVDTNHSPYARLVQHSDGHTMGVSRSPLASQKAQHQRLRQGGAQETERNSSRPSYESQKTHIRFNEHIGSATKRSEELFQLSKSRRSPPRTALGEDRHHDHRYQDDAGVTTPTCPSPTPQSLRPRLTQPSQPLVLETKTNSNMDGPPPNVRKSTPTRYRSSSRSRPSKRNGSSSSRQGQTQDEVVLSRDRSKFDSNYAAFPDRPSSPKSRNASRSRGPDRPGSAVQPSVQLDAISQQLTQIAKRVSSAQGRQTTIASTKTVSNSASTRSTPIPAYMSSRGDDHPLRSEPPVSGEIGGSYLEDRHHQAGQARANSESLPPPGSYLFRGRNLERPSSRVANHSQSPHNESTRAVSRGRQPLATTASPTPNRSSNRRPERKLRTSNSAGPVDLSQFRLIEEFTAPDCPLHGSRSRSSNLNNRAHRLARRTTASRDASGDPPRSTSRAAMHRASQQSAAERPPSVTQIPRAKTSGPRHRNVDVCSGVNASQNQVPDFSMSVETLSCGNPSPKTPFEPQTPKAMTLVYNMEPELGEEAVWTCVEKVQGLDISRPRSAVW